MRKLSEGFDLYNISVFLFFCMFLAMNTFVTGGVFVVIWYAIGCLCFALGAFVVFHKFSLRLLPFFIICVITSVICYKVNHNMSATQYIYLIMSLMIGALMADPTVRANTMKYVLYIYIFYITASFLTGGINARVFLNSSTNFVSVNLLYPAVVYYVKSENENRRVPVFPIVAVWLLCIFARGRGGILTATFLLFCIVLRAYREQLKNKKNRIIIGCALAIAGMFAVMCAVATSDIWLKWDAFEYFSSRGLKSKSRFLIWGEYFDAIKRNPSYLVYGAPFTDLKIQVTEIHNNMHNSFLNIHVYNGLVMLITVMVYLVKVFLYGIHNRQTIYLACLMTLCMRAFTDNVVWGTYGTPVFFFLLFFPFDSDINKRLILNRFKWRITNDKQNLRVK